MVSFRKIINSKIKLFLVYSDPQSFVQLKTELEFYKADKISDFSSHIEYHWKIVKLQSLVEFSCSAQNGWSSSGGWKIGKASKRAILIRARNKKILNDLRGYDNIFEFSQTSVLDSRFQEKSQRLPLFGRGLQTWLSF